MSVLAEVLAANEAYVSDFGDKGRLGFPATRQFAILTYMYARLDPANFAGLSEGDAHMIRNAGGRAAGRSKHQLNVIEASTTNGSATAIVDQFANSDIAEDRRCRLDRRRRDEFRVFGQSLLSNPVTTESWRNQCPYIPTCTSRTPPARR